MIKFIHSRSFFDQKIENNRLYVDYLINLIENITNLIENAQKQLDFQLILTFSIKFNHSELNLTIFDQIRYVFDQIGIQNQIYSPNLYRIVATRRVSLAALFGSKKSNKRRFKSDFKQNLA